MNKREWEDRYFPGEREQRELDELKKDPRKYGAWLADQAMERLRKALTAIAKAKGE